MLESLYIRNLVLVPELHLEFGGGFNTVTGETGAGKSLILGALHLLTGGRAAAAVIRRGAIIRRAIVAENAVIEPGASVGEAEGDIAVVGQNVIVPAGGSVAAGAQLDV